MYGAQYAAAFTARNRKFVHCEPDLGPVLVCLLLEARGER
jgi:hypothetical protein